MLLAQNVYVVAVELTRGVPVIEPGPVLKVNPDGRAGSYSHVAMAPPVFVKTMALIALPRVRVAVTGQYIEITGKGSLIVRLIWTDAEPPELLAQMV